MAYDMVRMVRRSIDFMRFRRPSLPIFGIILGLLETTKMKLLLTFLYRMKGRSSYSFPTTRMVGALVGGLLPEILKTPIFSRSASAKKNSVITNKKYTTRFAVSLR